MAGMFLWINFFPAIPNRREWKTKNKNIYIYIYMGVSKNRGTPKMMVYNGKPY